MPERLSVHRIAWRTVIKGAAAASAIVAVLAAAQTLAAEPARPFSPHDLVTMDRVSDPNSSPDGKQVAYQLRETDLEGNKGVTSLWLAADGVVRALTAPGSNRSPRWRRDGRMLYFLSGRSGSEQVWRLDLRGGDAQQVTHAPLDIGSFVLAPDGRHLLVSIEVFQDCETLDCSKQRLEERAAHKSAGQTYDQLFVRHWDRWSDGTRSQLFAFVLDDQGNAQGAPLWISRGIDADIPSKPEGDDSEYTFTPDSREVIFAARVAGRTEPWSTNFDLLSARIGRRCRTQQSHRG
jgi:dipeptidyl aminopeptidase/acylaminoacyl peptidase